MTARGSEAKTLRSLARAIGRRCRGRTLLVGRAFPELLKDLEGRSIEALTLPLDAAKTAEQATFDTVVLVRAIEYESGERAPTRLRRAFERVGPQGRLLVCVPHGEHLEDPALRQRFTRRDLKELLKTIDQPKVYNDQPFRWLLMAVDTDSRLDRATEERHRVMAGLCRGTVLELGCAAGHLSAKIAEGGLSVVGVDKNKRKIEKARRLFPGLEFVQADILKLATDRTYDTVVLAEVLEHVPQDVGDGMLAKAWALVAPGGRLVVSVPNENCVPHANHLRVFTQEDLAGMLGAFGRPGIVTDQPFKWLLAYVDRRD